MADSVWLMLCFLFGSLGCAAGYLTGVGFGRADGYERGFTDALKLYGIDAAERLRRDIFGGRGTDG